MKENLKWESFYISVPKPLAFLREKQTTTYLPGHGSMGLTINPQRYQTCTSAMILLHYQTLVTVRYIALSRPK